MHPVSGIISVWQLNKVPGDRQISLRIRKENPLDGRCGKVNDPKSHKIIVPLPPRYIVEKLQLGPLELSWDQVKMMLICAILTTIVIGAGEGTSGFVFNVIALSIIWGLYYKYARSHELLIESRII